MNPPISWLRAPRTLRSRLVRLLVVRSAAFATLVAVLLVGQVMSVRPSAAPFDPAPSALPSWTAALSSANPDCIQASQWPAGEPASAVVAHRFNDDTTARIAFMTAWNANHNSTDIDDVWVLGICS